MQLHTHLPHFRIHSPHFIFRNQTLQNLFLSQTTTIKTMFGCSRVWLNWLWCGYLIESWGWFHSLGYISGNWWFVVIRLNWARYWEYCINSLVTWLRFSYYLSCFLFLKHFWYWMGIIISDRFIFNWLWQLTTHVSLSSTL